MSEIGKLYRGRFDRIVPAAGGKPLVKACAHSPSLATRKLALGDAKCQFEIGADKKALSGYSKLLRLVGSLWTKVCHFLKDGITS